MTHRTIALFRGVGQQDRRLSRSKRTAGLVIVTKFGFKNGVTSQGLDSRAERIREVAEASLRRLRIDRIVSPLGKGFLTGTIDVELEPTDLRDIDAALAEIQVVGDRYPAQMAALVGR